MKKIVVFCIGVLLMVAVGCGGSSSSSTQYPANTPEGVAQAYYQALKDGKPDVAYQYRKFNPPKTKEQFVNERKNAGMTFKEFSVSKGTITGTTASVPVTFKTGNSSMPEFTMNIQLIKENTWLISDMGLGGQAGHGAASPTGMPPAGSAPPTGSTPPAGSMPPPASTTTPPADAANSGVGGTVPSNK